MSAAMKRKRPLSQSDQEIDPPTSVRDLKTHFKRFGVDMRAPCTDAGFSDTLAGVEPPKRERGCWLINQVGIWNRFFQNVGLELYLNQPDLVCWTCVSAFRRTSAIATLSTPTLGSAVELGSRSTGRTSRTAKECTAPEARTTRHAVLHVGGPARTTICNGPADESVSQDASASRALSGIGIAAFHPASALWSRDGTTAWPAIPLTPLQPLPPPRPVHRPKPRHSTVHY